MLKTNPIHMFFNGCRGKFAIRRVNREQFTTGPSLRCPAFIFMNMRCFCTNNGMERFGNSIQSKYICCGSGKYKKRLDFFPKDAFYFLHSRGRIGIITLGDGMTWVHLINGLHYFRMDAGIIITCKSPIIHEIEN